MKRTNVDGAAGNPFKTGGIVTGRNFIGRGQIVKSCLARLRAGNSLALCGLPRIGKSSLAHKLINELGNSTEKKLLAAFEILGERTSFFELWRCVALGLEKELEKSGQMTPGQRQFLTDIMEAGENYEKLSMAVPALFKDLAKGGLKTILVLDEFDSVKRVFGPGPETLHRNFQFLRGLATDPDNGLALIIVSRRSLEKLETAASGGSVLHLAVDPRMVIGFDGRERAAFQTYAKECGLELSEAEWAMVEHQAGRSPFMLSKVAAALFEAEEGREVKSILKECAAEHFHYFRELIKLMREDGGNTLEHMFQIFFDTHHGLTQNQINELVLQGYIWKANDRIETLSKFFEEYLCQETRHELEKGFWPLYTESLKRLRQTVKRKYEEKYGQKWEEALIEEAKQKAADPKKYFVNRGTLKQYLDQQGKGGASRDDFIERLLFLDFMNIILNYWDDYFHKIFTSLTPAEIKSNFQAMQEARNCITHVKTIPESKMKSGLQAFKKILNALKAGADV